VQQRLHMSHLQLLTILESHFTMSDIINSSDKINFVCQHQSEISSAPKVHWCLTSVQSAVCILKILVDYLSKKE
jgi:hypothetical protein